MAVAIVINKRLDKITTVGGRGAVELAARVGRG